jgi:predicted ATPase
MTAREFLSIPLDPHLVASSFQLTTHWYVLTGAACCGKTTLIDMLSAGGYNIIPESARLYFDTEIAKGRSLDEMLGNGLALQDSMDELQLEWEDRCPMETVTFLDRGMPDSLSFYRLFGGNPNLALPRCFHHRYAGVFILDRLPLQRSEQLGPEDEESSRLLDEWLERDYRSLGYAVIRVPVLPPRERLAYLLDHLQPVQTRERRE